MNWDVIEANWATYAGQVRAQWGRLTLQHLLEIAGRRDALAGRIQQCYGIAREEAEQQIDAFEKYLRESR